MTKSLPHSIAWLILLVAMLSLSGCSDEPVRGNVGDFCDRSSDCLAGICLTGSRFPDGMCSARCDFSVDCPSYAECIEIDNGVCVPACERDGDCPNRYECRSFELDEDPGRADVCLDD